MEISDDVAHELYDARVHPHKELLGRIQRAGGYDAYEVVLLQKLVGARNSELIDYEKQLEELKFLRSLDKGLEEGNVTYRGRPCRASNLTEIFDSDPGEPSPEEKASKSIEFYLGRNLGSS